MNEWMVRTSNLQVLGPFSKDEVIEMIQSGEVLHQDEVCRGNSYWFFVHEQDELQKQLGIQLPVHKNPENTDEITETDTRAARGAPAASRTAIASAAPKESELSETSDAGNTVMFSLQSSDAAIEFEAAPHASAQAPELSPKPQPAQPAAPSTSEKKNLRPVSAAPPESPKILKGLVSALLVLSMLLLWMALQRL